MPTGKGHLSLDVTGAARSLTDEQRVFIECIEDVLASTPGLHYALFLDRDEIGSRDPTTYALFLVETTPALDLTLSIELREKSFVVHVNEISFTRRRGLATRFEWWVERRCRDLERMVGGDLRLVQQMLLSMPVSSRLEAGANGKWRHIATLENGLIALLSFFLPYGFLMGAERKRVFHDWFGAREPGP